MRQAAERSEPYSSSSQSSQFLIGQDSRGSWIVRDRAGRRGGLFINRTEALKYALFENGRGPQAVLMVPGILELHIGSETHSTSSSDSTARPHRIRQSA